MSGINMSDGNTKARVLFLCTGNSCRSQMAEGWARHLHGGSIDACSAGTDPHGVNEHAIEVMREAGVDISAHTSKRVEDCTPETLDLVITVCGHANEHCPVFLKQSDRTRVVHHGFDDPPALAKEAKSDEEALGHYRRVRDEIRAFIEQLTSLVTNQPANSGAHS